MEAFLPGVGDWNSVFLLRDLWHFHFYGTTPLALVTGRERIYLEHFWNDFAADAQNSVSETDREFYASAYARPGHMAAGMEVFRAFPNDAEDFAGFARTKLTMPLLVLSGEKAGGPFLIEQGKMVATRRGGRACQSNRTLADGRSARSSDPETGRISRSLGMAAVGAVCDSFANNSNLPVASIIVSAMSEWPLARWAHVAFSYRQS